MRIEGSTVLLTGASGGIGHAIGRALRARGASLVVTGRRADVLGPLAEELGGHAVAVDLSRRDELERLLGECGPVDILVANAGLPASGTIESFSVGEIDRALDVNLRAPMVLSHALAPAMVASGKGHLVFVSSISGKVASPGASVYNATKYGLRGFAAALRAELRGNGVGVSAVFPGFISDAGMFADTGVTLPAGVGTRTPQDVAAAVVSAIERDRGEIDVAPLPMRAGTLLGGIAPELAARVSRRLGSDSLSEQIAANQRDKR
jgi:short-subunit dehydrogenase